MHPQRKLQQHSLTAPPIQTTPGQNQMQLGGSGEAQFVRVPVVQRIISGLSGGVIKQLFLTHTKTHMNWSFSVDSRLFSIRLC